MNSARTLLGAALVGATAGSWPGTATADEQRVGPRYLDESVPAPSNTFELKVWSGYTQGFGNIAPDHGIISVAGPGIGVGVDTDVRINATISVGLESQYQEFTAEHGRGARAVAFSVGASYHTSPEQRGDFWGRLGTGYRMLWDVHPSGAPDATFLYHGFDIATVKLGYDIRTSSDVAVAPVIGADLQTFIWSDATPLGSVQIGTFVFAGIQGRFDARSPDRPVVVAASPPPPR